MSKHVLLIDERSSVENIIQIYKILFLVGVIQLLVLG